jgi:hypothetical protein
MVALTMLVPETARIAKTIVPIRMTPNAGSADMLAGRSHL